MKAYSGILCIYIVLLLNFVTVTSAKIVLPETASRTLSYRSVHSNNIPEEANLYDHTTNRDTSTDIVALDTVQQKILVSCLKSVSTLLSTCGIGAYASSNGLLNEATLSVLSKLIFNLLQPCLLFVNVASVVSGVFTSSTKDTSLFLLPLAALFQIALGSLVGKVTSFFACHVYKTPNSASREREIMSCTAFGNSGPLPLVFAAGLFKNHKINPALASNAIAYISLYLLGWSPSFWIMAPGTLGGDGSGDSAAVTAEAREAKRKLLMTRIFSPPVISSLLGMILGTIPLFQNNLIASNGLLNPLLEAMRTLGSAYLPCVLLVLSGSLANSFMHKTVEVSEDSQSSTEFAVQVSSIMLARFFIMPIITFGLYRFTKPMLGDLFDKNPLLLFVLLLESFMPSAQNLTVILQLQGKKTQAGQLAKLLMFVYILGVPAITFWLIKTLDITALLS